MAKIYITNSFSLAMLSRMVRKLEIDIQEITPEMMRALIEEKGYISYIGHSTTAQLLSDLLGISIPYDRKMLTLEPGYHEMIVVQVTVRLGEGQVLSKEEIENLYKGGFVKLLLLRIVAKA